MWVGSHEAHRQASDVIAEPDKSVCALQRSSVICKRECLSEVGLFKGCNFSQS